MPIASKEIKINPKVKIGGSQPLFLIGGPCVIESEKHTLFLAKEIKKVCQDLQIPLIFKASFDKANRSSVQSYRGPGLESGLEILKTVKEECTLPVLSDVHETGQIEKAAAEHEEMLRLYGGHALSHYELGKLYEEMRRYTDAQAEYEKFLEMWSKADEGLPQLEDARVRLAKLKGV